MLLSDYAKKLGIQYMTAWNHYKSGKIHSTYQLPSGTIIVPDSRLCTSYHTFLCKNLWAKKKQKKNRKITVRFKRR